MNDLKQRMDTSMGKVDAILGAMGLEVPPASPKPAGGASRRTSMEVPPASAKPAQPPSPRRPPPPLPPIAREPPPPPSASHVSIEPPRSYAAVVGLTAAAAARLRQRQ